MSLAKFLMNNLNLYSLKCYMYFNRTRENSEIISLALTTQIFGGKKVLFQIPIIIKDDVIFLKELVKVRNIELCLEGFINLNKL